AAQRHRGGEELGIRCRHEEVVGIPPVEGLAALEGDDLNPPEGRPRSRGRHQGPVDLLGQGSGIGKRSQRERQGGQAGHRPGTFDSSQSSSSSVITRKVPISGPPTTTPTPSASATYPRVAGASSPPTSAREKMPLKKPGW